MLRSVQRFQFKPRTNLRQSIVNIENKYGISEEKISENTYLMALNASSNNDYIVGLYAVAAVLAGMVVLAGIFMITGSINSNVAQRTSYYGMLRCLGAGKNQVRMLVRLEALFWCKTAVPAGCVLGIVSTWGLCSFLRGFIGEEFSSLPVPGISPVGIICGSVLGLITVWFAASSPARRAAKASPITAATGYAVENAADYDGVPVDVAVVPSGTVRDTYAKGDITVEQVFNSFSLGIGADGVPGYPLISVYLTGKELKTAAEIDASVSDFMTTARLYCSGLDFTYNPNRMILNKVTDVYLDDGTQRIELEDDKLYRVVADLYSGQMLSAVTDMSYGLLSLVPKYADGTPIEDFEDVIITENGKELKAWDAIARYMESFEDTDGDGIANVPEYYSTTHYRKQVDDSRNIVDLVKNPNKFTAIIVGAIAVLILLVIFIIVLIKKIVKKVKSRKMKK